MMSNRIGLDFPGRTPSRWVLMLSLLLGSGIALSAGPLAEAPAAGLPGNASRVVSTEATVPAAVSAPTAAFAASGAFFALSVPDARRSAAWYGEKLGMTTVR